MKEICAGAAGEELAMDKFWGRKDVLLLVPGSLPCLRGVYSHALKLGKLHQFRYIRMSLAQQRSLYGMKSAAVL